MLSLSLFEGNCNECPLKGKNPFMGKDGLYNLARAAYRQYVDEVVTKGKPYRRFTEDFLNGHTYSICTCFQGRNEHKKNLGIIKGILRNCQGFTEELWRKGSFEKDDFMAMQDFYDATDVPLHNTPQPPAPGDSAVQTTFECYLNKEQMSPIAECANEAHLFYTHVSADDMYSLLHCRTNFHLYANRINLIAKLFDCLSYHRLVCHKWQSVLHANKLILSCKTGEAISPSSYSSALSKLNKREDQAAEYIGMMVKRVKEMGRTDGNENK